MTTTLVLITPNSGSCAGGTTVIIGGTGFTGATAVEFGSVSATSFTVNSDTEITAVTPPMAASGAPPPVVAEISVTVGGDQVFGPSYTNFNYVPTAPVVLWVYPTANVTGISPTSGNYPGGQTMTITGVGFTDAVEVSFVYGVGGTVYTASFTVNSDTEITATVPAIGAGYAYGYVFYVTVTTANGVSVGTPASAFTYNPA